MNQQIHKYLDVSVGNADAQWRSRLLNVLLIGIGVVSSAAVVVVAVLEILRKADLGFTPIIFSGIGFLIAIFFIYQLNRIGKIYLASSLFIIALTLAIMFANLPALSSGVTMFYFVIPVMMSSVLIRPSASFVVALSISILLGLFGLTQQYPTTFYLGVFGLMAIALASWISSYSLENALHELQLINQELDQRVSNRTQELADANFKLEKQASELASANQRLEQHTRDLHAANEKLRSLDRLKSKFVSDVSHELRTPISNLMVYIDILRLGKSDKQEQYINILHQEITRLAKLTESVLDLTRIELGTRKTACRWVDFNQIAEQVISINQLRGESKGLLLTCELGENVPTVWADSSQLTQVASNLISNAVNYTQDGFVKVSTSYDPQKQAVCLKVQDSGMGIGPEDLPHLFERFYRGTLANLSNIPGTGLGLSIAKDIVDNHKGEIHVESELGVGSTFTVWLPQGQPEVE